MSTTTPRRRSTGAEPPDGPLAVEVAGTRFANPIVLAAGTAGYGLELDGVMRLERLGGIVTKAVSVTPRAGAPAPRVAEFNGGMINAVGLANPGLEEARTRQLPDLLELLGGTGPRVIVNVVGNTVEEFAAVVRGLEKTSWERRAPNAYELNVSCPNVKAGGMEFGADPVTLRAVVEGVRGATELPVLVKLSPALPDIVAAARVAVDAGADGLTLVNTLPGLVVDVERRRPALGFGTGGVSGPGLLPVGVLATWKVSRALPGVPLVGVGGVSSATDALQYIMAGATLVGIGTAAMRDPRTPERVVAGLEKWCARHETTARALVGTLEWPS
ncbi:MAG TPA: dihydroorotate dehydrogenase [Gemmatimonadaceae bacterium]